MLHRNFLPYPALNSVLTCWAFEAAIKRRIPGQKNLFAYFGASWDRNDVDALRSRHWQIS